MFNLLLIILILGVSLAVFIWIGTLFFQGYIYTEPTPGLAWQAPAAGAIMAGFFGLWCFLIATSPDAHPEDIPYDTLFRFSPKVEMVPEPVDKLWAIKKKDERVLYTRFRIDQRRYEYRDTTLARRPWNGSGVQAIELEHQGEKHRFEPTETEEGAYPSFRSPGGWIMKVYETGPTGVPTITRTGRLLGNLTLNFLHLALWFVCLWLVLRFQWPHALGIGFVIWLLFTLVILPMVFSYAAAVAQTAVVPAATP